MTDHAASIPKTCDNRDAPTGASTPAGANRITQLDGTEESRAMPILPRMLGDDIAYAMSRTDGCPECVGNVEPPRSAIPHEGGFLCAYVCTDCGHKWSTSWANERPELGAS